MKAKAIIAKHIELVQRKNYHFGQSESLTFESSLYLFGLETALAVSQSKEMVCVLTNN